MKKINLTSLIVVLFAGVLTAFLWFPLLPLIVPLVTLGLGLKWVSTLMDSEADYQKTASQPRRRLPNMPFPNYQVSQKAAWSSLAGLPPPAGAGSLPFQGQKEGKSLKRYLRENKQVARLLHGLELRKSAHGH